MNLPLKKRPLRFSESSSEKSLSTAPSPMSSYSEKILDLRESGFHLVNASLPLDFPSFSPLKRFKFDEQAFYDYSVSNFESQLVSRDNYEEDEEEINVVDVDEDEIENKSLLSPFSSTSSYFTRSNSLSSSESLPYSPRFTLSERQSNFNSVFHTCKECGKKFESALRFKAHLRRHSSKSSGRYSCNLCEKKFVQRSSLTTHFRIHSGERPYKCTECPESFGDFSTFTKHKRTHTGEKPYACPICSRAFSQSGNMHRHWKSVHSARSHRI